MKLSQLLSLSLTLVGGLSARRILSRRRAWEQTNNRIAICVDYDDAYAAAIRAGQPFEELLHELFQHGATHVSLPERSLNRLLLTGVLTPQASAQPLATAPRVGHWNYLHGPTELIQQLANELAARLPYTAARAIEEQTLAFAGELQTIGEIGLGFDDQAARLIIDRGLGVVPRPISYAWPEKALIERTLAHAAELGKLIAFDGNLILGHEMHLSETLDAMNRLSLSFVYFAESRQQKGDWFIAKRCAPAQRVVLAQRFAPAEMISLDFHAAAHQWAYLARERGIRFCYVNFFKVLHATEPLEGLHYIEHIREALEETGFEVTADVGLPTLAPAPDKQDLALSGLASAGIAATAIATTLTLPEPLALSTVALVAAAAAALPYLEKARGPLEEQYPPSYAPKLLALTAASLAPVAASGLVERAGSVGWALGLVTQAAAAAALAADTSGPDYHLRIEEYRGFNLDWLLPFASVAWSIPNRTARWGVLAALSGAWYLANQRLIDPLAKIDPAHAEGHTHHLSTFARVLGDARIALGLQPARKWAGVGPIGLALSVALADRKDWSTFFRLIGSVGLVLGLSGFRRPERALAITTKELLPSWGLGVMVGALLVVSRKQK